jgi:hypothetical protein
MGNNASSRRAFAYATAFFTTSAVNSLQRAIQLQQRNLRTASRSPRIAASATGDSAKSVKLSLSAAAGPLVGSFRIVGRSTAEPQLSRTAGAAVANVNASTADLWLSVLKGP